MANHTKLALLAGVIASDGHLHKSRNAMLITTSDKNFLKVIAEIFAGLKIRCKVSNSISGFGHKKFVIYVNDKNLRMQMESRYQIPKGRKSALLKLPENLGQKELAAFVCGLFSGDASVYADNRTGKNYPQIMFWTKSKILAKQLQIYFTENGIVACESFSKIKQQHRLTIRRRLSLQKFREAIGFIHPRKKELLDVLLFPELQRREAVGIVSTGCACSLRRRSF